MNKIEFIKALRAFVVDRLKVTPGLRECKEFADVCWNEKDRLIIDNLRTAITEAKKSGISHDSIHCIVNEYEPAPNY